MSDEIIDCLFLGNMRDSIDTYKYDRIINCLNLIEPTECGNKVDMDVIRALATIIDKSLNSGERVLVHCGGGIDRSPLVVIWYLHTKKDMSLLDAFKLVSDKRWKINNRLNWLS